MLTADQLDALPKDIVELYELYEQTVINDMARRLINLDMTSSAAMLMQRSVESGKIYENALHELSIITGKSESVLRETFRKAGVQTLLFDDSIYRAAGLSPLPLNLSPAMQQVLLAGLQKTMGVMRNLTMTTAISSQQSFIQAADLAYLQVSNGAFSYNTAIRRAVKSLSDSGIKTIDYISGHQDRVDVAMRRTVLTGVSQTSAQLQTNRADEMKVDLVQTSAHLGARPTHMLWQGQIFSRNGDTSKYPDFVTETGYGDGDGICGWNCRHSFYPFFLGISENAYKRATLDKYADKVVTYNGTEMSFYDATQYQRLIERNIRRWKRQAEALASAGLSNTDELQKVSDYQSIMRDFLDQTSLVRQSVREQITHP